MHLAGLVALGSGGAGIGGVAGSAVLSALLFGLAAGVVGGGAVRSRDRRAALLSLWLVIVAIALPLIAAVEATGSPLAVAPFLALLAWRVVPDTLWAASDPWPMSSRAARTAVRRAVIVLAAAIAAGPAGFVAGCAILALLPLAVAAERAMAPSVRAAEITPPIARGPWAC